MVDATKIVLDVSVDDPAMAIVHDAAAQVAQGAMGGVARPETIRTRMEIRFVDWLHEQQFPLIQKTSCIAHYLLVFLGFKFSNKTLASGS